MIEIAASGSPLRTNQYYHHVDTVAAIKSLQESNTNDCCFCSCESVIPALADPDNITVHDRNDVYSWIFKIPSSATVTATLTNLDTGGTETISDNTYGNFYSTGTLKSQVWGFIIKWANVANLWGYGNYSMNITVLGVSSNTLLNKTYPTFRLMPYTCETAHGTVRIQTANSGYIESGFDYRDIFIPNPYATDGNQPAEAAPVKGWIQQVRWYGRLTAPNRPVQIDNIFDTSRDLKQTQTQIEKGYNLRLDHIKDDVSDQIIEDYLLSDYILISDYNANNTKPYRDVKCSLESIDDPETFLDQTQAFNIKFVPYRQNGLKRYY